MNESNRIVNLAMRSRNSSNPKLTDGSVSAIEGLDADSSSVIVAILSIVLLLADGTSEW